MRLKGKRENGGKLLLDLRPVPNFPCAGKFATRQQGNFHRRKNTELIGTMNKIAAIFAFLASALMVMFYSSLYPVELTLTMLLPV
jgi:hypothetical protein